jgi:putative Mg2+ transporter-C (MgtC) family protein
MNVFGLSRIFGAVVISAFSMTDQITLVARVGAGALLGGVVGWERDRAGKNAGIRTHMLVAAASSLAVGLGSLAIAKVGSGDPTRMMHAVFTGIGFIGAGMIWTNRRGPQNLTSAATVLLVAGIGASCGMGAPFLGFAVTVFALVTLIVLRWIENRLNFRHEYTGPLDDE